VSHTIPRSEASDHTRRTYPTSAFGGGVRGSRKGQISALRALQEPTVRLERPIRPIRPSRVPTSQLGDVAIRRAVYGGFGTH
jgi:hypothetical protein